MLVLKQGKLNKNLNQTKRRNFKFLEKKNPSFLKLTKLRQMNLSFLDEQKDFVKNKLELRTTFYRLLKLSQVLKTSLKSKNALPVSEFLFQESFLIKSKTEEKKTKLLLKLRGKLLKKNHFKFFKNLRKVKFSKKKVQKRKKKTFIQGKKRRTQRTSVSSKKNGKENKGVQKPSSSKKQPEKNFVLPKDFKSQQHFSSPKKEVSFEKVKREKKPFSEKKKEEKTQSHDQPGSLKKKRKRKTSVQETPSFEENFQGLFSAKKMEGKKVQIQKEPSSQEVKGQKKSRSGKKKAEGERKSQEDSLSLKEKKEKNDKKSESGNNKKKSK